MEIHHQKHHNTYVTNLNVTLEKIALEAGTQERPFLRTPLQPNLKFNGGGHEALRCFGKSCNRPDYSDPEAHLKQMIERDFGSFENMKKKIHRKRVAVQGSGWGWLGLNKETKTLHVVTTANQDPCITTGLVPIFGVDVWEHAYYLQYKNRRLFGEQSLGNRQPETSRREFGTFDVIRDIHARVIKVSVLQSYRLLRHN